MEPLQTLYEHYGFILWIVSLIVLALLAMGLLVTARRARRIEERFDDLFENASSDNMSRLLADCLTSMRATSAAVQRMKTEHDQIAATMPSVIRHVGLVRFSPFHDTGGDQSFALALLDGRRDGVIVTGLHSRAESRLYAKPIERGMSGYTLTPEEREAMDRALGGVAASVG